MHKEIVISFKCNLTNEVCNDALLDCNDCKLTTDKNEFFCIHKKLLSIPTVLNEELTIGRAKIEYTQKFILAYSSKEVMFSDISKEISEKYTRYRKYFSEHLFEHINKYYYSENYPLLVTTNKYVYMFAPDTSD